MHYDQSTNFSLFDIAFVFLALGAGGRLPEDRISLCGFNSLQDGWEQQGVSGSAWFVLLELRGYIHLPQAGRGGLLCRDFASAWLSTDRLGVQRNGYLFWLRLHEVDEHVAV